MAKGRRNRRNANQKPQTPKRDRISTLPDAILAHILSFLPETEEAARTCVLSKRWRHVWSHLPNLRFRYRARGFLSRLSSFSDFVDRTLFSHSSSINRVRFDIHGVCASELGPVLAQWIRRATGVHHAVKLSLNFSLERDWENFDWEEYINHMHEYGEYNEEDYFDYSYQLPPFLDKDAVLRKLGMTCCDFSPRERFACKSLKFLDIKYSKLTDEMVAALLAGSPVLESMRLENCVGISRMDIASHSLKKLVVADIGGPSGNSNGDLVIWCPNLNSLKIFGVWDRSVKLINASSLKCARFDFARPQYGHHAGYNEECRNTVVDLLKMVSHVDQLELGSWCIDVLSEMEFRSLPIPPLAFRSLVVQIINCLKADHLPAIFGLIRNASNLERLVLGGSGYNSLKASCRYHSEFNFRISQKKLLDSLSLSLQLKTIELDNLEPTELETELEVMKYLLKNCGSLHKVTILGFGSCDEEEREEISQKLLSFPRASPHVVFHGLSM